MVSDEERTATGSPMPMVSVVIVGYESRHDLDDCLGSVLDQDYAGEIEVLFVDNASTDGSADYARRAFPRVCVIESGSNLGYAGGTNLGFRQARGEYLVSLNPDTAVDPKFVSALVETSRAHADRALVTSRILYFDDPATVNIYGNVVNFGLVAACRGIGEPRERHETEVELASISGCAFLMHRSILRHIGPFEEALHLYLEDTDLSLRALLSGYRCVTAPGSLVFHKYRIKMSPRKFFQIERNRWVVMLRVYRAPTLLILLPGLLMIEALAWVGALRMGHRHVVAKTKTYPAIVQMLQVIRRGRNQLRPLRQISDRAILARLQGALPVDQLVPEARVARIGLWLANIVLAAFFWVARCIIRW